MCLYGDRVASRCAGRGRLLDELEYKGHRIPVEEQRDGGSGQSLGGIRRV